MARHRTRGTALLLAAGLTLAGCAVSDPTRYYALATPRPPVAVAPAAAESVVTVGVGPVTVPGYLGRPQVVTRTDDGALEIWPYHRWAEPLDVGIAQALAEDLAARIPGDRIAVFPWRGVVARTIDYQVAVAVARFDGCPGHEVTLDARWRLLGKDGIELAFKRTTRTEPIEGTSFAALVHAMSRAIGGLGQEIGDEIRARSATRAAGQ